VGDDPCPLDVAADLRGQLVGRVEPPFVTQARQELQGERSSQEVAVEVQQVRLDVQRLAAERGVRPDVDGGCERRAVRQPGPSGVDATARHEEPGMDLQVRGGPAQSGASSRSLDDPSVQDE
jgi:hypothetical protein